MSRHPAPVEQAGLRKNKSSGADANEAPYVRRCERIAPMSGVVIVQRAPPTTMSVSRDRRLRADVSTDMSKLLLMSRPTSLPHAHEKGENMSKLANKVAFVTGASRGIGAGIAKRLASEGADVVVTYAKDAKSAAEVVKAMRLASTGHNVIAVASSARPFTSMPMASSFRITARRCGLHSRDEMP
jgi:3-oxoacyl-ACP reductase-like protein